MKRGFNLKGQISVFIIFGIIIAIILGVISYNLVNKNNSKLNDEYFSSEEIKPQIENIESNILLCIGDSSQKGLEIIGKQGGYYNKPQKYLNLGDSFIPYYYYEGEYFFPSQEDVSKELESYVNKEVDSCLNELNLSDFEIKPGISKTTVSINKDSVNFEVDNLVTIRKDKRSMTFETKDYPINQPAALKDLLDVAYYITDSHKTDPKMYCISCIENMAKEKNVYVRFTLISNDSILVIIGENRTSETPYLLSFLNKYTGNEESNYLDLTEADPLPDTIGGF